MKTLILGGVKSGKSRLAETLAQSVSSRYTVVVVATALPKDAEMDARITRHRADRPAHWEVVEEPYELGACIQQHDDPATCLLVDCLTLWLTQVMVSAEPDTRFAERKASLLHAVEQCRGRLILVSNETGLGIMPMNALARRFCDEAGSLHQQLAAQCQQVVYTVAGLPLYLKGGAADEASGAIVQQEPGQDQR